MSIEVSFVIPCYRSALMIEEVVGRLQAVAETRYSCEEYEIILVDDCSPDDSFSCLKRLAEKFRNIKVLSFSKNFGQQAGLMAGFGVAEGEVIVCLDDDGQTPPEDVFLLIDKLHEGYDLVYASYENKQHGSFRNFGSWVNEKMAESLIGKPKGITLSSFYAVRHFLVEEALHYIGPYPYIAGQFLRATSNITNVAIVHQNRLSGESGYSVGKLFSLWLNGFTAFSVKPLRMASLMGVIFAIGGLLFAAFVVARKFFEPSVAVGWTSTFALILVIGGLILFVLGLIGEYVGRAYICINNAPQYVVNHAINCKKDEAK